MNPLYLLGLLFQAVSFVCFIIIVIDAFKNEVWKGILTFVCCFYSLYYAFTEYQSENKTKVIAGWLVCGLIAGGLLGASGAFVPHTGLPNVPGNPVPVR